MSILREERHAWIIEQKDDAFKRTDDHLYEVPTGNPHGAKAPSPSPFDKSPDAAIRGNMDKTRYPRAALLESMVRFVIDDLAKKPAAAANSGTGSPVTKPDANSPAGTTQGILDGIFKKKQ